MTSTPRRWSAAALHLVLAVTLGAWVFVSHRFFALSTTLPHTRFPGSSLLAGWVHYDAGWYRDIALNGYVLKPGQQSNVAFFPAYPLAMRGLAPVLGSAYAAGIALTFLCGLAAVVLFDRWCSARLDERARRLAVVSLLLYPYVWYLVGAVYADALFLVACLAAFTLLEEDHPVLAGLAGALASAARPTGPALVLGLVVRRIEQRGALRTTTRTFRGRTVILPCGVDRRRLRPADAGVLLAGLGFAAYSGYLWARFGDPFLFDSVQRYWDQGSGPATWFKTDLIGTILWHLGGNERYVAGCLLQGSLLVGGLALVPRVRRRAGWGYATLTFLLLAIPLVGSKDFQGTGRYLLAAFPLFAVVGAELAGTTPARRTAVLGVSAAALLLWSHLFARGYYVA